MKKIVIVILLFSNFVYAQSSFNYGGRVGFNLVSTSKDKITGKQFFVGFNGGAVVVQHFSDKLSLKSELNYSCKSKQFQYTTKGNLLGALGPLGGTITGGGSGTASPLSGLNDTVYSSYRGIDKFGFIEVPLIFCYTVKKFDFGIGAYAALLISAKSTTELTQSSSLLSLIQPTIDTLGFVSTIINGAIDRGYPALNGGPQITESKRKDSFTKMDYGFIADFTYHYLPNLFLNFRYQYGVPNYRIKPFKTPDNYTSFTFSIGYLFHVKNNAIAKFL
jgi:Outer membrane protein beta-barrel domain